MCLKHCKKLTSSFTRFQRKFKLILLFFLVVCAGFSLWFSLSLYGYGSSHPVNYFISFTVVNVAAVAVFPVFYEAVVESTYPVPEGSQLTK